MICFRILPEVSDPWCWQEGMQPLGTRLPTDHLGILKKLLKRVDEFQIEWGIWKCWFFKRGENWSTCRKTSGSKGENQQQTYQDLNPGHIGGWRVLSPLRHPCFPKGDFRRDDSQRRFLAKHSVVMLEQCCNYSEQCRNNVATRCCSKNRRCESSLVTSPLKVVAKQNEGRKPISKGDVSPVDSQRRF